MMIQLLSRLSSHLSHLELLSQLLLLLNLTMVFLLGHTQKMVKKESCTCHSLFVVQRQSDKGQMDLLLNLFYQLEEAIKESSLGIYQLQMLMQDMFHSLKLKHVNQNVVLIDS
jgi:hypothetical protein